MSLVESDDHFFARVVLDMLPHELYTHQVALHGEDGMKEAEGRYLQHKAVALTAEERKAASKDKKQKKYSEISAISETVPSSSGGAQPKESNLENLRGRLQQRILSMKASRSGGKAMPRIKKMETADLIERRDARSAEGLRDDLRAKLLAASAASTSSVHHDVKEESEGSLLDANRTELPIADGDWQFNSVRLPIGGLNEGEATHKYASHPLQSKAATVTAAAGGKKNRLKKLLADAERSRERMSALKQLQSRRHSQSEEKREVLEMGMKLAETDLWTDALQSAAGDRKGKSASARDVPKLKKALKKIERRKERSAHQWEARLATQGDQLQQRIEKREQNLLKRKKGNAQLLSSPGDATGSSFSGHKRNSDDKHSSSSGQKRKRRVGFEGKKTNGEFLS